MKWTWHVDLPPSGMAILLAVAVFLGYAVCTAVRMGQRVLSTQGLCKAAASGDAGAVHQALSAWGLDVNAGDGRRKCTPLIIAAAKGRGPVVGQLLAAGAAVDSADETGRTPLSFAAARGDGAVVGQLVAAGAAVDQANDNGSTPLWLAAGNGHAAIVGKLLAAGAAVDKADHNGCTPLLSAVENGREAVAERLLAAGAVMHHADCNGMTPLDAVFMCGPATARVLLAMLKKTTAWRRRRTLLLCLLRAAADAAPPDDGADRDVLLRVASLCEALWRGPAIFQYL
jgi:ankyrin repeat protein